MIQIGDIGLSHRRSGFYSRAVGFFTRSYWTHGFIVCTKVMDEVTVLEADLKVQLVPFVKEYIEKNADAYEIYSPKLASDAEKIEAARATYFAYAGQTYGFLQILWFVWDWLCAKVKLKPGPNKFPSGVICSELQLHYLLGLNDTYRRAFGHLTLDEVNPEQIAKIVKERVDLFGLVLVRL